MIFRRNIELAVVFLAWFASGCALIDDSASNKLASTGLIATPPSYYSTAKARYLGTKYKENLDRLAERIVRNPNTATLQFANNISSVGGIGFFTHSATETPDERYLEVVLATPETFETKREYSEKVHELFSRYGPELLGIIAGDSEIFADQQLSGYGLNFTWRTVTSEATANRVSLARAVIYFDKEKVGKFLRQGLSQNELLRDAVIFAVDDNGPLELVSYQPREIKPDFRPAIREDNLPPALAKPSQPPSSPARREAKKAAPVKKETTIAQESPARGATNVPMPPVEKGEPKTPAADKRDIPLVSGPAEPVSDAAKNSPRPIRVEPETTTASTTTMASPAGDLGHPAGANKLPEASTVSDSSPVAPPVAQSRAPGKVIRDKTAEIRREETASAATKQTLERKPAEAKAKSALEPLPLPAVATSKGSGEAAKLTPMAEIEPAEIIAVPTPMTKAAAPPPVFEEKVAAVAAATMAKPEDRQPGIETVPRPIPPAAQQTENTTSAAELPALPMPEVKAKASARPQEKATPVPAAVKIAKPIETKKMEPEAKADREEKQSATKASLRAPAMLAPVPKAAPEPLANPTVPAVSREPVKTPEVKVASVPVTRPKARRSPEAPSALEDAMPSPTISVANNESPVLAEPVLAPPAAKQANAEKPSETKEIARAPLPVQLTLPPVIKSPPEPVANTAVPPVPAEPAKAPEVASAPVGPHPVRRSAETPGARESVMPPSLAKSESPAAAKAAVQERAAEKPAAEQLALLRKPEPATVEKKPLARPMPRPLEGFIIQIGFSDKEKAQNWAEKMERRGYAVSVTEAGATGALRVRVGNFTMRDDAERELRNFKQQGMNGIVINLPQAFRPVARSSVP